MWVPFFALSLELDPLLGEIDREAGFPFDVGFLESDFLIYVVIFLAWLVCFFF